MIDTVAVARCSIKLYRMEKIFKTKTSENQANQFQFIIFLYCAGLYAVHSHTRTRYSGAQALPIVNVWIRIRIALNVTFHRTRPQYAF